MWACYKHGEMLGKLTIIGPGLLGGSIGMAARHRKVAKRVVVWSRRPEAGDQALQLGAADEATHDLAKAVTEAGLVVLATPIGVMAQLATQMKPALPAGCVVTDVGSVKYPVVTALSHALPKFVGAHPMAGSEQAGIDAARRDLFQNAVCILTPTDETDKAALQTVHDFWKQLGCVMRSVSPQQHDEIVAHISHLPHVVAAAVVNVACGDDTQTLSYAGPGFRDFTRIAGGPPDMWTEIAVENRDEIRRSLDRLIEELTKMRAALANQDAVELHAMLQRAKHYRDELRFRV